MLGEGIEELNGYASACEMCTVAADSKPTVADGISMWLDQLFKKMPNTIRPWQQDLITAGDESCKEEQKRRREDKKDGTGECRSIGMVVLDSGSSNYKNHKWCQ
ncbi:hypothetical protein Dimus_000629 [Dionaea muscipula]